jgi:hypothetical protein
VRYREPIGCRSSRAVFRRKAPITMRVIAAQANRKSETDTRCIMRLRGKDLFVKTA